jgi:alpha-amylase
MTGEVNPHGVSKDLYFTEARFDSLLNIKSFSDSAASAIKDIKSIDAIFTDYASKINNDLDFNMLSFISFHDTDSLFYNISGGTSSNQKIAGSLLTFCPGAIQIFYGDECGRKNGPGDQKTRSQMPWDEDGYRLAQLGYDFDSDIHAHWSKVLNFRKNHVAVGAGTHTKIKDAPYTFSRVKGSDKVIVVLGASGSVEVDVSTIGATKVKDAYTGNVVNVTNGKATFTADSNGVILIEAAE